MSEITELHQIDLHRGHITKPRWSPDGRFLAVPTQSGSIGIFDLDSRHVTRTLGSLEQQKLFFMCQIFKPRQVSHFRSRYIQKLESCGLAVVVAEHSTKSLSSADASGLRRSAFDRTDKPVSQTLVICLSMIVGNKFSDGVPQGVFAKEDHLLQTIFFDRPDKPFRVRV